MYTKRTSPLFARNGSSRFGGCLSWTDLCGANQLRERLSGSGTARQRFDAKCRIPKDCSSWKCSRESGFRARARTTPSWCGRGGPADRRSAGRFRHDRPVGVPEAPGETGRFERRWVEVISGVRRGEQVVTEVRYSEVRDQEDRTGRPRGLGTQYGDRIVQSVFSGGS